MASGEMSPTQFADFLHATCARALDQVLPGGIVFVCMDWRSVTPLITEAQRAGLELLNLCVWTKTNAGMGGLYRSQHELIPVFKKPGAAHINNVQLGKHGRNRSNVWSYAGINTFGATRDADLADHPTVKPVALVADAIQDVTHRGDLVLDPFGGSGTTMAAAHKTGRRAALIELDPIYVDVIIRRMSEHFNLNAVHAETGESFADLAATRKPKAAADTGLPSDATEAAYG
jgi:DNA modification methylase